MKLLPSGLVCVTCATTLAVESDCNHSRSSFMAGNHLEFARHFGDLGSRADFGSPASR